MFFFLFRLNMIVYDRNTYLHRRNKNGTMLFERVNNKRNDIEENRKKMAIIVKVTTTRILVLNFAETSKLLLCFFIWNLMILIHLFIFFQDEQNIFFIASKCSCLENILFCFFYSFRELHLLRKCWAPPINKNLNKKITCFINLVSSFYRLLIT